MKHRAIPSAPAAIAAGALLFLLALGAGTARADTLKLTFDDARMSIGPLEGQDVIPPGADPAVLNTTGWNASTGAFTAPASALTLPSFTVEDIDASAAGFPLALDLKASLNAIGSISGNFSASTGVLETTTLNIRATISAYPSGLPFFPVASCTISPIPVPLATEGELGDTGYAGDPLDPEGSAVAEWASLPPATGSGAAAEYCSAADPIIGGPGGIWLDGTQGDPVTPVTPGGPSGETPSPATAPCKKAKRKSKKGKGKRRGCAKKKRKRRR